MRETRSNGSHPLSKETVNDDGSALDVVSKPRWDVKVFNNRIANEPPLIVGITQPKVNSIFFFSFQRGVYSV